MDEAVGVAAASPLQFDASRSTDTFFRPLPECDQHFTKFGTCACELGERRDTVGGPALAPLILGNIANRGDDVAPSQAERTEPHCSVVSACSAL